MEFPEPPLPLEILSQEIIPRISFNDLLSLLATSKSFCQLILRSVSIMDWFVGPSDTSRKRDTESAKIKKMESERAQFAIRSWAYRGIALEKMRENLQILMKHMDGATISYVYLYVSLYHPHLSHLGIAGTMRYLHSHGHPGLMVGQSSIRYVREFVTKIARFGFQPLTAEERISFGSCISNIIKPYHTDTPNGRILGEYVVSMLGTKYCMDIITNSSYNQNDPMFRFQYVIAKELYKRNKRVGIPRQPQLTRPQLNRILAYFSFKSEPFIEPDKFQVSAYFRFLMRKILAIGGLYCENNCCRSRPPRRDSLGEIYSCSSHHVEYDFWLAEALFLLANKGYISY
jgi:hypothetical protein